MLYTLALAYAAGRQYTSAADTLQRAIAAIPPGHPNFAHRLDGFALLLKTWRELGQKQDRVIW